MSQQISDEIRAQADKIARDCDRASIRDSIVSAGWYRMNLWLGVASAVLAGIIAMLAGADFKEMFGDDLSRPYLKVGVVVLASSSAILTSIVTFLAPAEKANIYHEYSNRYWALRDRIRQFAKIECLANLDVDQLKVRYEKLLHERIELDSKHPVVPEWVYEEAGKKLLAKMKRNATPDGASS